MKEASFETYEFLSRQREEERLKERERRRKRKWYRFISANCKPNISNSKPAR